MGVQAKKITYNDYDKDHHVIMGTSRFGKTYFALNSLKDYNEKGVFFFNTQHEIAPSEFVKFNGETHTLSQLIILLNNKRKVCFYPSLSSDTAEKQLAAILKYFRDNEIKTLIAVDECHLFKKSGKQELISAVTTGLRWGRPMIFITQRPAMMDNTYLTQSTRHIYFALGLEDEGYLREKKYPIDDISQKINGEKYRFVIFDRREAKGPYRI